MLSSIRLLSALLLLVLVPDLSAAQSFAVDKGSLLIGGSASFSSSGASGADHRFTYLQLQPTVQYFVVPGLAVGGDLLLYRVGSGGEPSTMYGVGPTVSYYFGEGRRSVYPFVSGGLDYYRSNDSDQFGYGVSSGAVFMLNSSVGLSPALYYQHMDHGDADRSNSFGVSVGVSAFVF